MSEKGFQPLIETNQLEQFQPEKFQTWKNKIRNIITTSYKFRFEEETGCFWRKTKSYTGKVDYIYLVPKQAGLKDTMDVECGTIGILNCRFWVGIQLENSEKTLDALYSLARTGVISLDTFQFPEEINVRGKKYWCRKYQVSHANPNKHEKINDLENNYPNNMDI